MKIAERLEKVVGDLNSVAHETHREFGPLTVEQLNWKPSEKSWSVAQCLDHVIVLHSLYFPIFDKLAAGNVTPTLWERASPFSGLFGRLLIKSIDPENLKPSKTSKRAYPSSSNIDGAIVLRYVEHQQEMVDALEKLPADLDLRTIITSPLMGLVTYSLDDTLTILPMHCRRHYDQAKRVIENDGFPKTGGV
ncbi:MAG TPA: DinB family protein [Pyrinomonadaceae bacterium]|nr:DinB family protein [Pyrinomonadaceae bacterium]